MSGPAALTVAPAGPRLAGALAGRTFPRYRPLLDKAGTDPGVVALALFEGRDAIGLLLGRVAGPTASLLSVSVADSRRRRGGGAALLAAFEREAAMRGARRLAARFTAPRGPVSPVRALFSAAGWTEPARVSTVYAIDREASLAAPWFTRAQPRLRRMLIQPWREAGDRVLRLIGPANWCHEELHPRAHLDVGQDGAPQDYDASALLRAGPEPDAPALGWVVVHRIGAHDARITAVAVRPDRVNAFAGGALIAHANRALYESGVARATFVVRPHEARMTAFAERRIVPLGATVRESFDVARSLPAVRSAAVH